MNNSSMQPQWEALRVFLRKTDTATRGPVLLEGAIWYLIAMLAAALGILALSALVPTWRESLGGWPLWMGLGAATLAAAIALGLFLRRKHDEYRIAASLQRHHPEFRNDLVAALEFGEKLYRSSTGPDAADHDPGFSRALAEAHIARTARTLADLQVDGHLGHLIPRRELTIPAISLAATALLVLLPMIFLPTWTLNALFGARPPGTSLLGRPIERPVVGPLDITLTFPAYMGIERQYIRGSTGYIEAIAGTSVTIRTTALMPETERIEILLQTADSQEPHILVMARRSDGLFEATFDALHEGTYQFRAVLNDKSTIADGLSRPLRVLSDDAPVIEITEPAAHELEVRPDDIIDLQFHVSDDFGIAAIDRVFYFAGGESSPDRKGIDNINLSTSPRSASGSFQFDLKPLNLQPKDTVTLYLEARDHNKTTGPGIGKSAPITLYVASPEDKHLANIADQQAIAEALLLHLADFLEAPVGERKAQKNNAYRQVVAASPNPNDQNPDDWKTRIERIQAIHNQRPPILENMEQLAKNLREDPLMLTRDITFFTALLDQLQQLHDAGTSTLARATASAAPPSLLTTQAVADYAARSEDVLEKGVLRFEELLASQKMELIQSTAEDIRELKERLKELLEQYRATQDPELKAAIKREVQRLRQRMAELMARMQMQLKKLPQEHMNMEALQAAELESDSRQLADQLQSIEEMLDNDDIDGALAALDQMDQTLDSLTQDMDKAFSDAQPEGISELDQKVAELLDQTNDLESLEKSIEHDTRQLQQEMAEQRKDAIEKMLKPFTDDMLRRIDEQTRALDKIAERELAERDRPLIEEAQKKLQSLREMVEQQDIEQSLQRAKSSLDSLRALRQMMNLSQRYMPPNTAEYRQTTEALAELNPTVPRGQQIVDELEKMMNQGQKNMQPQHQKALEELAERQKQAAEQAEKLGEQLDQASERFPTLDQQLRPQLDAAKEAMQQAQKSLSEPNTQRALDEERAALDQLGQLKQSMRDALQREKNQQRQSGQEQSERVEIPTQDSRQSHERYRKEVMEGMREGRLEDYQSEIERYYKSLVE